VRQGNDSCRSAYDEVGVTWTLGELKHCAKLTIFQASPLIEERVTRQSSVGRDMEASDLRLDSMVARSAYARDVAGHLTIDTSHLSAIQPTHCEDPYEQW
jgi:hypothetical protein